MRQQESFVCLYRVPLEILPHLTVRDGRQGQTYLLNEDFRHHAPMRELLHAAHQMRECQRSGYCQRGSRANCHHSDSVLRGLGQLTMLVNDLTL